MNKLDKFTKALLSFTVMIIFATSFFLFYHNDIVYTLVNTKIWMTNNKREFYDAATLIWDGLTVNYLPTTFILFSIVLSPFSLFTDWINIYEIRPFEVYWSKFFLLALFVGSSFTIGKIYNLVSSNPISKKYSYLAFTLSPIAFFSVLIFSQYDVLYVFLILISLYLLIKKKLFAASLIISVAITFKTFPLLVFLPLLLLVEKRIRYLIVHLSIIITPTLIYYYIYRDSTGFIQGVREFRALNFIFGSQLIVGISPAWSIYLFFVAWLTLLALAFLRDNPLNLNYDLIFIFLVASTVPFLFSTWHPQWLILPVAGMTLANLFSKRRSKMLILDIIGMLGFTGFTVMYYVNNVDTRMFRGSNFGLEIQHQYLMLDLFDVLKPHSMNLYLTLFWVYLIINIISNLNLFLVGHNGAEAKASFRQLCLSFILGVSIFLIPACLIVQKEWKTPSISTHVNQKMIEHGPISNRVFKQEIIAKGKSLESLEILFATYQTKPKNDLIFKLTNEDEDVIFLTQIPTIKIRDNEFTAVTDKKVVLEKNKKYMMHIYSSEPWSDDKVTVWASGEDVYKAGSFYINTKKFDGDLIFKLFFKR